MRRPSQPDGHRLADMRHAVCRRFFAHAADFGGNPVAVVARGQPREIANKTILENGPVRPVLAWVTIRLRSGTFASTARRAEPLHHGHHEVRAHGGVQAGSGGVPQCPCLESNQHLPRFRRAPSPDRLQGRLRGRGGARPQTSSTFRLSKSNERAHERGEASPCGIAPAKGVLSM